MTALTQSLFSSRFSILVFADRMLTSYLVSLKQNIFKDFYSDLAGTLVRKLPVAFNKFNNNSTKQYYMNIGKSCHNLSLPFFLLVF